MKNSRDGLLTQFIRLDGRSLVEFARVEGILPTFDGAVSFVCLFPPQETSFTYFRYRKESQILFREKLLKFRAP